MNNLWAKFEITMKKEGYEEGLLKGKKHTKIFNICVSKQKLFCSAKLGG